ncbi:MAG: hypothetical protein LAN59_08765 [Acidobacteriia bacterium]|nr:hypothetical protein [Terriglobia bacterium]
MTALLDEIIQLAEDDKNPLPNILRKCLRLASDLKDDQLKKWANQELDGYEGAATGNDIPAYRRVVANAYGSFAGPFNAWAKKHIIIPAVMEEKHRHFAESANLVQSVSALNDLITADITPGVLVSNWPPNLVAYYSETLWQGWVCHAAWQEIPTPVLVQVLDTVRNITFRMALEIKEGLGTSYTDLNRLQPEQTAKAQNIIINNLGGNVALGDVDASGSTTIIAGDRKSLDAALVRAGMTPSDLKELTEAIQTDGNKAGSKVSKWIGDKAEKMLVGGVKIGASIAQQVLTEMLMQHYGLKKF